MRYQLLAATQGTTTGGEEEEEEEKRGSSPKLFFPPEKKKKLRQISSTLGESIPNRKKKATRGWKRCIPSCVFVPSHERRTCSFGSD